MPQTITKTIKQFNNTRIGKSSSTEKLIFFLQKPDVHTKKIKIKLNSFPVGFFVDQLITLPHDLSFSISQAKARKILAQVCDITSSPKKVAKYLKPLNDELASLMRANELNINQDYIPDYLLTGNGFFIPGPSKYPPYKKGKLLDQLLLQREQAEGVNLDGTVKFVDVIPEDRVNRIVSKGYLFSEETMIAGINFHGSYTHRLILQALWEGGKKGVIDLTVDKKTKKKLNFLQFIELLILAKYNDDSFWATAFDSATDSVYKAIRYSGKRSYLDPKTYAFSNRSPFVMNMMLICLGKKLDLLALQLYLLDSFYKTSLRMIALAEHHIRKEISSAELDTENMYIQCMNILATQPEKLEDVGGRTFFTYHHSSLPNAYHLQKYDLVEPGVIKKIEGKGKGKVRIGPYKSAEEYIHLFGHGFFASSPKSNTITEDVIAKKLKKPL
ncbi:MAG: hypothetical protein A3F12_07965 [Gammaproteobacteria bacterium RIFCSPHIGHO2_12_FULL_38_14]|nr:MAG: hypothetical protein A3F12_07965 [Gammaproteobacteria bacterium RIFCSPHIGHO2_12_FULL_38_14]